MGQVSLMEVGRDQGTRNESKVARTSENIAMSKLIRTTLPTKMVITDNVFAIHCSTEFFSSVSYMLS